jgi:uncharacterized protein (TIGR00369 family)
LNVQDYASTHHKDYDMADVNRTRTYTWDDPMISAGLVLTMPGVDWLKKIISGEIPAPPIAHTLDFRLTEVDEGRAVFTCVPAEFHYNPIGVVHGGLLSTLMDSALGCCIQSTLPAGTGYTTLELHVNFTRAVTKDTGEIRCEATALHSGRRMATAEAKVYGGDGKLYGHGTTTCMVFSPGS